LGCVLVFMQLFAIVLT